MCEQGGRTLLHYAAYHGNCDVVDVLLSNKADADATDKVSVATFKYCTPNDSSTVQLSHFTDKS